MSEELNSSDAATEALSIQLVQRLEQAWSQGESPSLTEILPAQQQENLGVLTRLIAVDLQRRLQAGEDVRVEAYVDQFPRLMGAPSELVELIAVEYRLRRAKSPGLAIDEYLDRFPMYRQWLSAKLSSSDGDDGQILFSTTESESSQTSDVSATASNILNQLVERKIVDAKTIEQIRAGFDNSAPVRDQQVIDSLLEQGLVTSWQLKQVRAGQKTFLLEGGRYLLLDEIGRGGMGSVYRARHTRLNRDVALKVIDPREGKNSELIARFRREIEISSRLQHEHIVHTYDMGQHEGVHFLVLEYLHGSDLASLVRRDGPMAPDEAAAVALQATAALAYAHAQGVIHRDIKPHNILLSTDGIVKILDLGLAAVSNSPEAETLAQLTQSGVVLGTVDYMAPEQAADMHSVDSRSDIYSLGATLYFLLTGRPPFAGGALMNKLHKLANVQPPTVRELRPDCPQALSDIVERMMAKDPNQRYQSTIDVLRALQPLAAERIAGRPVVTRSVQLASDTTAVAGQTAAPAPVSPFDFLSQHSVSVSASLGRHHKKENRLAVWLMTGAVAAALIVGFGIWAIARKTGTGSGTTGATAAQTQQSKGGPVDSNSPDAGRPPSQTAVNFPAHFGGLRAFAWAPDDSRFATASSDGQIRVWSAARLDSKTVYRCRVPGGFRMCWSPDSRWIAARGDQYRVHVFNSTTGDLRCVLPFPVTGGFAFSPDGQEIAASTAAGLVRWNFDLQENPVPVSTRQGFDVRYSRSGRYVLVIYNTSEDYLAQILDVKPSSGGFVWQSPRLPRIRRQRDGGTYYVRPQVEITDDETTAVVALDGKVEFWNIAEDRLVRTVEVPKTGTRRNWHELSTGGKTYVVMTDADYQIVNLTAPGDAIKPRVVDDSIHSGWADDQSGWMGSLSHSGRMHLLPSSGSPSFWITDLTSGRSRSFGFQDIVPGGRATRVYGNRIYWVDTDGSERITFDLLAGEMDYDMPNYPGEPHLSRDGVLHVLSPGVFSGLPNERCELWPVRGSSMKSKQILPDFEQLEGFTRQNGFGWANDGAEVWIRSADRNRIRFWDTHTGKVLRTIDLEKNQYANANPRGRLIVRRWVGQEPGSTSTILKLTLNRSTSQGLSEDVVIRHPWNNAYWWFSPNDRWLAAMKDQGYNQFLVWDAHTGKQHLSITLDSPQIPLAVRGTAFSPTGRYLFCGDTLWDLEASPPQRVWEMPQAVSAFEYFGADFVKDDRFLLLTFDAQVQVWDWQQKRQRLTGYMLPGRQWMFFNRDTGCWAASDLAFQYLDFLYRPSEDQQEWVAPYVYEQRSGWKNDPEKVGLEAGLKVAP